MEALTPSSHLDVSPAPWKPEQSALPDLPVAPPTFLPARISDSGALVLDQGQTEDAYIKQLQKLIHTKETLQKAGYVMQPLSEVELDQKKKCERCHKCESIRQAMRDSTKLDIIILTDYADVLKKPFKWTFEGKPKPGSDAVVASTNDRGTANATSRPAQGGGRPRRSPLNGLQGECKYHSGYFNGRTWSCCRTGAYNQPCKAAAEHKTVEYKAGELERQYRYYRTPAASTSSTVRQAVAIDCEMGTGMKNDSLCIRVSVVDYFTAKVLVDKLVFPDEPLLNYNTRFSGVSYSQMARAKAMGDCLFGVSAAREAVWKFIGPDTIVVAHSGQNDLNSLRWLHGNIVDTQLVESLPVMELEKQAREKEANEKKAREEEAAKTNGKEEPIGRAATGPKQENSAEGGTQATDPRKPVERPKKKPKGSGRFSLKSLTKERIGKEIQSGKEGHDSVIDAVATRDVAHWNVINFGHGFYEIKSTFS